ncbi:phage holin family protein [Endozoicomonas sp. G2_1]|uniref:phage holin family protein n=1 Tax=Endozoicomonas sp. G2_1 TaxID=2821091 RepID=UPI001ADA7201|nr:phage holin family protein [Endozoicomonas sp. G2_1]MBO9492239.1 phage holin family protein [Endozoicomonas sp. G2_1]
MNNESISTLSALLVFVQQNSSFFFCMLIAVWGSTAAYIARLKKSGKDFSLTELIGEWSISGFAGMLTVLVCQEFGVSLTLTAFAAGISGHMGGTAIHLLEQATRKRFPNFFKAE